MKLTLRPEWRLWPFTSFLGLLDLKTGVTVALLFVVRAPVLSILHILTAIFSAVEQSRWSLRLDRRINRCGGVLRSAQPIHILCPRPRWSCVGSQCGKRGLFTQSYSATTNPIFLTGRPKTYTVLCPPVLRRPHSLYSLDCLFRCQLVDIHSS
jgi:hypothetical protein